MTKKNNFLLVDLNEKKTKKLAETITSDTSRKILNYLAEKEHDTETNIAQELKIPISTVHYHLQKLTEASLIIAEEFHYSKKGREINHYKLANKYIIIAPRKVSGLRQALKNVLPVGIIAVGISAVIKLTTSFTSRIGSFSGDLQKTAPMLEQAVMMDAAPVAQEIGGNCLPQITTSQPDIALWFLVGSLSAIVIYLLIIIIKEWRKK
ncbi:helix-turn-helix domain-containing protein [Candidatus Woesearchaeota archaeon]|jgi:DNA-binding transcriptional ArsR family regulator|nr:helix-turn-helix domain-containing protein [Candidatus Woesearchaeota archaeon]